jgi:N-acetyl-anhydromuramyl-L-alanine amidase AmpD
MSKEKMNDDLASEELNRIRAETAKLMAEKEKIEIEKQTLINEASRPWYRKERFIQAFVAGLLGFPILWFFFNEIIKPIYLAENMDLQYRNQIARLEIGRQKTVLDSLKRKDSLSNLQLLAAWDEARLKSKELETEKQRLIQSYGETIDKLKEEQLERDRKMGALTEQLASIKSGTRQEKLTSQVNAIITKLDQSKASSGSELKKLEKKFDSLTLKVEPKGAITMKNFWLQGEGISHLETPKNKTPFGQDRPDAIVFHFSASRSLEKTAEYETKDDVRSSLHIFIGKDGSIIQLVPLNTIAWHVGQGTYKGRSGYNNLSIGINFINAGKLEKSADGKFRAWYGEVVDSKNVVEGAIEPGGEVMYWEKFSDEQIARAHKLCELLVKNFKIKEILGHSDLSAGRKLDPGPAFPLKQFQEKYLNSNIP